MADKFLSIGSPVKDFVSSFLEQVDKGAREKGFIFCRKEESHIEMELNAVETKEVGGSIKIHIFSAGGKMEDVNSQKMKVYFKKPSKVDKEEEKVRLKIAKHQQKYIHPLALKDLK